MGFLFFLDVMFSSYQRGSLGIITERVLFFFIIQHDLSFLGLVLDKFQNVDNSFTKLTLRLQPLQRNKGKV